ncbi:lysozyme inhibitor LprI family protein [Endozoicomonas numazuensis]|uniref:Lysozyme inhibitor LprI-like N-terminal domain-containing protein n=1 Tax=Endozoicomonas numazuensis TaxID=1137799 RepID=A0A081NGH8_9GAMM|nr:lysozyme inhibitor LprI family protein [Endozoicomonas numazuensis]KEQ17551.1 hypothetical protein GZ78_17560 [Endozoicomonas numazuensis]
MKIFMFILLSFLSIPIFALDDCTLASTQYEMNICLGKNLENVELKLERKISEISKVISNEKGISLLLESNNSWKEYRDKHCLSVSNIYEGGSLQRFIETECKITTTEKRIESIQNDYKDTIDIIQKGRP